jgi:hypothetical protein
MQNYDFDCGFVWLRNFVSDIKEGTQTEDVCEQGTEKNIWTEDT